MGIGNKIREVVYKWLFTGSPIEEFDNGVEFVVEKLQRDIYAQISADVANQCGASIASYEIRALSAWEDEAGVHTRARLDELLDDYLRDITVVRKIVAELNKVQVNG